MGKGEARDRERRRERKNSPREFGGMDRGECCIERREVAGFFTLESRPALHLEQCSMKIEESGSN